VKVRIVQLSTIILFALVTGVFWGTWFSVSRSIAELSAQTFLDVGHKMIWNLGLPNRGSEVHSERTKLFIGPLADPRQKT
jgi:hypothetical protein